MNQYGYRYNINHPEVNKWYKAYLKSLRLPEWVGLTDSQRLELEATVLDPLWQHGKLPDSVFTATNPTRA